MIIHINKSVPNSSGRILRKLTWKTPGETYFYSTSGNSNAAESHLSGNSTMMLFLKSKARSIHGDILSSPVTNSEHANHEDGLAVSIILVIK